MCIFKKRIKSKAYLSLLKYHSLSLEFSVPSAYLLPKYVSFHLYTNHRQILISQCNYTGVSLIF